MTVRDGAHGLAHIVVAAAGGVKLSQAAERLRVSRGAKRGGVGGHLGARI